MTPAHRISGVAAAAVAIAAGGFWLGTYYTQTRVAQLVADVPRSRVERDAEYRAQYVGEWTEEMPVRHGSVPLIGESVLNLGVDGSYRERVRMLAPDRTALPGMLWATDGTWNVREGELRLSPKTQTGPTTRPAQERRYLAYASGDELSLDVMDSPDRGDTESHVYRRRLAKRIVNSDLEEAKEGERDP